MIVAIPSNPSPLNGIYQLYTMLGAWSQPYRIMSLPNLKNDNCLAELDSKSFRGSGQAGRKGFVAHLMTNDHDLPSSLEVSLNRIAGSPSNLRTAVRSLGERFARVRQSGNNILAKLLQKMEEIS